MPLVVTMRGVAIAVGVGVSVWLVLVVLMGLPWWQVVIALVIAGAWNLWELRRIH